MPNGMGPVCIQGQDLVFSYTMNTNTPSRITSAGFACALFTVAALLVAGCATGRTPARGDGKSRPQPDASKAGVPSNSLAGSLLKTMVEIPGKDFSIGAYEVTQSIWESVMGGNPSQFKGADRPVENVTWDDCQDFLEKLNALPEVEKAGIVFRLPTVEEWEYACRAGAAGSFCKLADGKEISAATLGEAAWYGANSGKETKPVGTRKANAFGLYDMHGNVLEWTSSNAGGRGCCGGGWNDDAGQCAVGARRWIIASEHFSHLGFRLAL